MGYSPWGLKDTTEQLTHTHTHTHTHIHIHTHTHTHTDGGGSVFFFFFLVTLWDLSSQIMDQTCASCGGSVES